MKNTINAEEIRNPLLKMVLLITLDEYVRFTVILIFRPS